jgi:hypothetical protein
MTVLEITLPKTRRVYRGSATPTLALDTAYYGIDPCSICRRRIRVESRYYRGGNEYLACLHCAEYNDADAA